MKILHVTEEDAAELAAIYAPYVEHTAVSFEYEAPDEAEFRARIRSISAKYPYLKAVSDGRIIGYAYAAEFKWRKAYDWSVETTIYLREDCRGNGVGRALYEELERELKGMGILNMNACIALAEENDPYLTNASLYFHEKLGFQMVGVFHKSGCKFGRWYDMFWMEKMLAPHVEHPNPVRFGGYR